MNEVAHSLKHHFLIAMPHMADPNFAHSVTYLLDHSEQGAMGLVINKPNGLNLADVLSQLRPDTELSPLCQSLPIFSGGPVQTDRGFVLHPAGPQYQATVEVNGLSLSTSQDILLAIADGSGPQKYLITLGYAGWEAGQLEAELADNAWLTCPADENILFDLPYDQRLSAAAASLGVNLSLLTSQAGHA
ncbi:YqgE/AlgH family protein [Pseudomonas sp. 5P_3.1_Bac2]|uniref:YqgE/AlgH family protein n=1 Tax=Pseudomonas sp. 5P_3.1_Bac2 TaxID=2971617 RepID=UPI0021C859A5|nr:YqgE/AlgH family protein [Pseudomonas sp. 5P_3.1_Bac2]MCU1718652.1 YqgE/AlgH family protein [Pseudomonas sp. 5P_3.1_Bac2]